MEDHLNVHKGARPFKCDTCSLDFASKYTYNRHLKVHTDRPRQFQCPKCDKAFHNKKNLEGHQTTHKPEHWQCHKCPKAFKALRNLQQHEISHTDHKPFACDQCDKSFRRRTELKNHLRIHTGEKPFVCSVCNAAFAQNSNLLSHQKTTHLNEEKFQCTTCERTFKRQRLLDCHVKSVHLQERAFECDACPATYAYPEHLRKHKVKCHSQGSIKGTERKQVGCEFCDQVFATTEKRNFHRFVHSQKKMYECIECEKGFMRRGQCWAHAKKKGHRADVVIRNRLSVQETADKELQLVVESRVVQVTEEGEEEEEGEGDGEKEVMRANEEELKLERKGRVQEGNEMEPMEATPTTTGTATTVMEDWVQGGALLSGYNSFLA